MGKWFSWKRCVKLAVLAVVLYLVIGMMVPFWHLKKVGTDYQESFSVEQFYGN